MQPKNLVLYVGIQQLKVLAVQNAKFIVRPLLHHIELYPSEQLERLPPQGRPPFGGCEPAHRKHLFRPSAGAFRCALCMINSSSGFSKSPCEGHAYKLGHRIWFLEGLHFCVRCGAYSGGRIGRLAEQCPGWPATAHLQKAKPKLLLGVHPTGGQFLGIPQPVIPSFAPGGAVADPAAVLAAELDE